jgi:hypothetical protein
MRSRPCPRQRRTASHESNRHLLPGIPPGARRLLTQAPGPPPRPSCRASRSPSAPLSSAYAAAAWRSSTSWEKPACLHSTPIQMLKCLLGNLETEHAIDASSSLILPTCTPLYCQYCWNRLPYVSYYSIRSLVSQIRMMWYDEGNITLYPSQFIRRACDLSLLIDLMNNT